MFIKIHEAYRTVVAMADSDIVGKTFEEDIRQIEVRESFFKGEKKTKAEAIELLQKMEKEDATFNIVGKEAIKVALEAGVINKNGIITIQGIPIALGLF